MLGRDLLPLRGDDDEIPELAYTVTVLWERTPSPYTRIFTIQNGKAVEVGTGFSGDVSSYSPLRSILYSQGYGYNFSQDYIFEYQSTGVKTRHIFERATGHPEYAPGDEFHTREDFLKTANEELNSSFKPTKFSAEGALMLLGATEAQSDEFSIDDLNGIDFGTNGSIGHEYITFQSKGYFTAQEFSGEEYRKTFKGHIDSIKQVDTLIYKLHVDYCEADQEDALPILGANEELVLYLPGYITKNMPDGLLEYLDQAGWGIREKDKTDNFILARVVNGKYMAFVGFC